MFLLDFIDDSMINENKLCLRLKRSPPVDPLLFSKMKVWLDELDFHLEINKTMADSYKL